MRITYVTLKILIIVFGLSQTGLASAQVKSGDIVDTTTERQAPRALNSTLELGGVRSPPPFGANIFVGGFKAEREDGLNPDYTIDQGDRITLRVWGGAMALEQQVTVDAQGNIFLPEVGPIRVKGIRNADLTDRIANAIRRVFTQNVNVYANLEGTAPVIVYVTGSVANPGSYAGVSSDTMLYYIDRAGGVDQKRGSYRDIRVLRDNRVIAQADLYQFLMHGELPKVQFKDGDAILVGQRGTTVSADGQVINGFTFEFPKTGIVGEDLLRFARPQAAASHATIFGFRDERPISLYLPLEEFAELELRDGDRVFLEADRREETMIIRVEGSHLGPSRFAVPLDTRLIEILDHIEIDPALGDIKAVSLKRRSLAKRQKRALEDTLGRLEKTVLGASSQTDEEARIRIQEAELLNKFVARARQFEPEGVLVVSQNGVIHDVLLQSNDVITVPQRTDIVMVSGEVMVPQAIVYSSGERLYDYISKVGGFTERANDDRFIVVRRTGEVIQGTDIDISPGDEILVLPKVPVKNLQLAKTITEMIFQIAIPIIAAFR